jgi:hypothetical protein
MKISSTLVGLSCLSLVVAQSSSTPDESLVDRPAEGIDYPGCYSDLHKADRNGDGFVKQSEYLNFIQEYGKRICFSTDELTLQQSATFNTLACICRQQEGSKEDCCLGSKARIPTAGALVPIADQTPSQKNYLTSVCKLTDATIEGQCPPSVRDRAIPPEALVTPVSTGGNDALMWGLIAAAIALALLLCCCCCVWRKKRMQQVEEEEEEVKIEEGQAAKSLPPQESAPPVALGPHLLRKTGIDPVNGPRGMDVDDVEPTGPGGAGMGAAGNSVAEDEDDDEEGRKRRGGGIIPPEDEETGLRMPTAPRLPPPDDIEIPPLALRPIPPKESENDEWDHPGRDINFPKDKDDMSAGEFDHYEPDGGVNIPQRERKDPLNWKKDWNRQKPEDPDEVDLRKHRIQTGLGEGEVWDKLGQDETEISKQAPTGDVFDWVVQSALGVLDKSDEAGQLKSDGRGYV